MLDIDDDIPLPTKQLRARMLKVQLATELYFVGDMSKREAARRALRIGGRGVFSHTTDDSAIQFISRRIPNKEST